MKPNNTPGRRSRLPRTFYSGPDTIGIARRLLGKLLVTKSNSGAITSGMIVETEAYCGVEDRAAHSFGGRRTKRNEVTFGPAGHLYVFFVYGMYHQLNIVTGPEGFPHVVLVRAVEPIEGIDVIITRRGELPDKDLTSGPGKLCIALDIDRSLNGLDVVKSERVWVEDFRTFGNAEIAVGPRVGIDYAGPDVDRPWRFWVKDSVFVSKTRRARAPKG
ncbi:MAG TPA: DNA-3-methyladenine glycosylase [Pyrinomonadaceae bacterium]|nr:DNA-3-methyladenine glycosylase [Pyrinomonadaceae bacterium]